MRGENASRMADFARAEFVKTWGITSLPTSMPHVRLLHSTVLESRLFFQIRMW